MHRYYVAPEAWAVPGFWLDAAESHHAVNVMRAKVGDQVVVFNGLGLEATVEIVIARTSGVQLRKLSEKQTPQSPCRITLGQAIPKGKNMELIVEKATELGAAAIVPFLTDRTVVRYDAAEGLAKRQKWQRVAIEAAKQCGQNWLPTVHAPIGLKAFFGSARAFSLMLIASLEADAQPLRTLKHCHRPRSALILIGPEGDFSPGELALAKAVGCRPMSLGPITLRTETAALYSLSVLSHEFGNAD